MNDYKLKEDGTLTYKGHVIGAVADGEWTFTTDAMRLKHANAVAELMSSGALAEVAEVAEIKEGDGYSSACAVSDVFSTVKGGEGAREVFSDVGKCSSLSPEDAMEEPGDIPIPRHDPVMGEFTAEWLRHDVRGLDRARWLVKWEPFARGNPENWKRIKKRAGLCDVHGL